MVLPVVKLGTLALKTICKPIANRLKKEAGLHPKFRQFIISIAQVHSLSFPLLVYVNSLSFVGFFFFQDFCDLFVGFIILYLWVFCM